MNPASILSTSHSDPRDYSNRRVERRNRFVRIFCVFVSIITFTVGAYADTPIDGRYSGMVSVTFKNPAFGFSRKQTFRVGARVSQGKLHVLGAPIQASLLPQMIDPLPMELDIARIISGQHGFLKALYGDGEFSHIGNGATNVKATTKSLKWEEVEVTDITNVNPSMGSGTQQIIAQFVRTGN